MTHEEQFRSLVDSVKTSLDSSTHNDFSKIYSHYGISVGPSLSLKQIPDFLQKRISEKLTTSQKGLNGVDFHRLFKQLIRQHIIIGSDLLPYIVLAYIIWEESRKLQRNQYFLPFNYNTEWKSALIDASDLFVLNPSISDQFVGDNLYRIHPRISKSASRIAWLKNQGFSSISVLDGNYFISQEDLSRLVDSIEQTIRKFGGINFANLILTSVAGRYDQEQCRYHLVRRCNPSGQGINPDLPVGYLLNLCVKHDNFTYGGNHNEDLNIFKDKAIALGCLYDVEPHSIWELNFKTVDTVLDFLREISLFDALFPFKQLRPTDICKIIKGLFDWVDQSKMLKEFGWNTDQAIMVINAMLKISLQQRTVFFNESNLFKEVPDVPLPTIKLILDNFSHFNPDPNKNFKSPADIEHIDYQFKPFLHVGQDYCFLDASWCGVAFYEAIATALRFKMKELVEDNIGPAGERFLKSVLIKKGVNYISGKYRHSEKLWECDIVIETVDTIIFIELKKKSLTRKAQGGSDVHLLLDVSNSLIDSQTQLGNHEILLRQQGFLDIVDSNGKSYRLEHRGREIERISLTLLDYGGIQDRRVISQLLTIVMNADFGVLDTEYKDKFIELNKKCRKLQSQAVKLSAMGAWHKIPYFNCWFLSIPQFLVLLDRVNSNDDFKKELLSTKHVTFGILDFYCELAQVRQWVQT